MRVNHLFSPFVFITRRRAGAVDTSGTGMAGVRAGGYLPLAQTDREGVIKTGSTPWVPRRGGGKEHRRLPRFARPSGCLRQAVSASLRFACGAGGRSARRGTRLPRFATLRAASGRLSTLRSDSRATVGAPEASFTGGACDISGGTPTIPTHIPSLIVIVHFSTALGVTGVCVTTDPDRAFRHLTLSKVAPGAIDSYSSRFSTGRRYCIRTICSVFAVWAASR